MKSRTAPVQQEPPLDIQALLDPQCYPHPVSSIRICETHISWVVLTGEYVYKIKKPVQYSFVDFSTLEKRRWFCDEELRLNARLAPELYLEVVPLTGSPAKPRIAGKGDPFEYAVKMRRFSVSFHEAVLSCQLRDEHKFIEELADRIGRFHQKIDVAGLFDEYGTPAIIQQTIRECFQAIPRQNIPDGVEPQLSHLQSWATAEGERLHQTFKTRKQEGFVRECHGDLHLGNIAIFQGRPCVFDALEFAPHLRWVDVMSEIAFLVMDLEKHGQRNLGQYFLNLYLEHTGDYEGLKVFRFYAMYRALVRAKVAGLRLGQLVKESSIFEEVQREMNEYLGLSAKFRSIPKPIIILMHGVSGSGKTTVSTHLLKALGFIRIRSDVERKRARFSEATEDLDVDSQTSLYSQARIDLIYQKLRMLAGSLLHQGFPVLVDATFLTVGQRKSFFQVSKEQNVEMIIVHVDAPENMLVQRICKRGEEGSDPSDATVNVLREQLQRREPFHAAELPYVLKVDTKSEESTQAGINHVCNRVREISNTF